MIDSIAFVQAGSSSPPIQAVAPSKPQAQPVPAEAVTVEISVPARAKLLKTEGFSVSEISIKLRLDEKTIDGYLNIKA